MQKQQFFSRKFTKAEWLVLMGYLAGLIMVIQFHEPWFDEAQAWNIARTASIQEILFTIPHYEGHPPLWHLLLAIFAKNGAPYVLTIRILSIVFCTIAIAIFLFCSPFPKYIRCLLPFTFFFFYQFGIISRPYSLFMIAVMLLAANYTNRNAHPWHYIFPMMLLCLSHTMGILFAGGLCIVWTAEILHELKSTQKLGKFWKDKRFWGLLCMLLLAILLFFTLQTAEDCYYIGKTDTAPPLLQRMISSAKKILVLPMECWFTSVLTNSADVQTSAGLWISAAAGSVLWIVLLMLAKANHKFWTFFLPNLFFVVFWAGFYGAPYHVGLESLFHVFFFWILLEQPGGIQIPKLFSLIAENVKSPQLRKTVAWVCHVVMLVPVFFTITSVRNEIKYPYGATYIADFIKENHLENNTQLMTAWGFVTKSAILRDETTYLPNYPDHYMPAPHPEIDIHLPYIMGDAVTTQAFFDHPVFMNFNAECPDDFYMHYQYAEDPQAVYKLWEEKGLPDFIFDYVPLDVVYDEDTLKDVKYLCIQEVELAHPFKLSVGEYTGRIFIRKDLLEQYPQFHPIYDQPK